MTYKINIPKPCHQDWNKFTQTAQGKHCQVCAKTVIDFTTWEPSAISNYLLTNKEEETCGRFTEKQLESKLPTAEVFAKQISYFRISTLKKIAAIFLFAFVLQNNSFANEATIHGGTTIIPTQMTSFPTFKYVYKVDKPKKKVAKKKKVVTIKHTKGKIKIVSKPVEEQVIMGKMIMPKQN